jgi:aspartyl aminopeptidase
MSKSTESLLSFLGGSPTPFHAVSNVTAKLDSAGYQELFETQSWPKLKPGKYYVTRNDSSLVAFQFSGEPEELGFRLVGAHTDSPCLKIKPNAITCNNGYAKLGVEVYGGVLLNPWFDRDLALAGRITVENTKGELINLLIKVDQPIAFIPSLAIHLDREVNDNRSINKQKDIPPVLCRIDKSKPDFNAILMKWIKSQHPGVGKVKILSFELSLYDHQAPSLVGLDQEFVASARLDNLLSCYAAIEALIQTKTKGNYVVVLNDHEEVGSSSTSGAEGPFLHSMLSRICGDDESLQRAISHSMLVSADNAHGVHPNFPEVHEPAHQPLINNGPVIKINNNQRYATNSETEAVFKAACEKSKVPCQVVVVRTDMGCGSTIGPITATKLGVRTVDIGVPQLGMHSIRELAGAKDQEHLVNALKGFFTFNRWPF